MATINSLMTVEEYAKLPDTGWPNELVQGQVVTMPPPKPRHGQVCSRIAYLLWQFLDAHPIGQILANDSGVITERDPDTVRGADVAYYSFNRVPKGPLPNEWLSVAPELIFEVLSPDDRWSDVSEKIDEYLRAGVQTVCIVDDKNQHVQVFFADRTSQLLGPADELTLPKILPGFVLPVRRIFE